MRFWRNAGPAPPIRGEDERSQAEAFLSSVESMLKKATLSAGRVDGVEANGAGDVGAEDDPVLQQLAGASISLTAFRLKVGEAAYEGLVFRMLAVYEHRRQTADRVIASINPQSAAS